MNKAPLIHITKRKAMPWQRALLIRICAIIISLVVCGILTTVVTGLNPLKVYGSMFSGAFGTPRRIWTMGQEISMLLAVALALTPAFRMRFWNLGAEGQVLMGGLATAACMILLGDKIPNGLLILLMLVSSVAAGAVWALIPAIFKARWNTNETLFTLMMNYVAIQLVAYFVIIWEVPKGSGKIGIINQNTEAGWLPMIGSYKYLLNILVVAAITVVMYIYMKYSKQGYEISVVGESKNTARYAVMVAWLAKFNPVVMILASLLLVFMERGAGEISTTFGLNQSFGDILTGIILFFIIGSEFFINYKLNFRGSGKDKGEKGGKE